MNSINQLFSRELCGSGLKNSLYRQNYLPNFVIESLECNENFSKRFYDFAIIAKEDGYIHIFDTDQKGTQNALKTSFEAHSNAVFDVKWFHNQNKCLTASADQTIKFIDVETCQSIQNFYGHTMTCRCISLCPDDLNVFATSSRDGSVRIWDVRSKPVQFRGATGIQSISVLSNCHTPAYTSDNTYRKSKKSLSIQSVTSLEFLNYQSLFSAGATDCAIKLWDFRKLKETHKQKLSPKFTMCYKGLSQKMLGYSDLVLSSDRSKLFACCLDSVIYEYDACNLSTRPKFLYTGHSSSSFYIKMDISPDSRFIVCGSSNGSAYVYKVGVKEQAPLLLPCSESEVSVVKWSKLNPSRLMALTDSCEALIWNSYPARRYTADETSSLIGIAHYSKANLMTPEMQKKRLLQSPVRSVIRNSSGVRNIAVKSGILSSSPVFNSAVMTPPPLHFSSPASGNCRQMNINRFLSDMKPKDLPSNLLKPVKQINLESLMNQNVSKMLPVKSPNFYVSSLNVNKKPALPISPCCFDDDEDKENIPPSKMNLSSINVKNNELPGTPIRTVNSPDYVCTPGTRKRISLTPYGRIAQSSENASTAGPKRRRTLFTSSKNSSNSTIKDKANSIRSERRKTMHEKMGQSPNIHSYFKKDS